MVLTRLVAAGVCACVEASWLHGRDDPAMDFMDSYSAHVEQSLHINGRASEEMARMQRHDESSLPQDEFTPPSTTSTVKDSSDNFFLKSAAEMEDIMDSAKHHSMKLEDTLEKTSNDLQSDRIEHEDVLEKASNDLQSDHVERSEQIEAGPQQVRAAQANSEHQELPPPANSGGGVVNIRLDSELQVSLLAWASKKVGLKVKRSSPDGDVEAAVAKQKMQDIYIHDGFAAQSEQDVKQESQVHADRNMKE
jgi:hypothetical protein